MDEIERQRQEQLDMRAAAQAEQDKVQEFLDIIRQIESSGGKDTDHKVMQDGLHKGHAAMGQYGLMPLTVKELANRFDDDNIRTTPVENIPGMIQKQPELEENLAQKLADLVLKKQQDEEKAAYSWNMGHNLSPEEIAKRDYMSHPYVEKFRRIKQRIQGRKVAGLK